VRRAVAEVFEAAAASLGRPPPPGAEPGGGRAAALAAHGHLGVAEARALQGAALAQVVLPSARALGLWKASAAQGSGRPAASAS
jgi:hypothetical protein